MSTITTQPAPTKQRLAIAGVLLLGAVVALSIGVYAKVHTPSGRPALTFGFSGILQMKAWLTTLAASLLIVQMVTALWMWGKLPRAGFRPGLGLHPAPLERHRRLHHHPPGRFQLHLGARVPDV